MTNEFTKQLGEAISRFQNGLDTDRDILEMLEASKILHAIATDPNLKVVPKEPTKGFPSMEQAGAAEMWEQTKEGFIGHEQARAIYKAMLSKAPNALNDLIGGDDGNNTL